MGYGLLLRGCAGCLRWRCGRNRTGGWCWRATAWASSRYISRAAGEDLFFGSELKTILVHPEIERTVERDGAGLLPVAELRAVPVDAGGGNRKAAAGTLAGMARRRGAQSKRIGACRCESPTRADARRRPRKNWMRCLQQSVREHLLSDVPLGVWLSGGIDSSTILHYAAKASPRG